MAIEMRDTGAAVSMALHGDVGAEITAQGVATALKAAGNKPLTISVHSYGGDAMAGVAIHNMLARHPAQKTVVVDGIAASAASLIAMAGDRIVMPSNAFLMIHNASGLSYGTAADTRDVADILDNISAAYRRTYAAKTGLPEDEIGALMDAETWLTADEAVAKGFATEAAEPAEIRMDASRLLSMPNLPAALAAITRPAVPALVEEQRAMEPEANIVQPPVMAAPTVPAPVVPQAPAPASLADLEAVAARARLGAEWVLAQMKAGATLDQARDAALDAVASQAPQASVAPRVQVIRDEATTRRGLMAEALAHKAGQPNAALSEGARQYRHMTLIDMARECLEATGTRTRGMPNMEVAQLSLAGGRYTMAGEHSTSDFPNILANTANKALRAAYEEAPRTFLPWTQRMDLPDFKDFKSLSLNAAASLQPVAQGGGINYGTIGEGAETWALARYNTGLAITYVAMINDDLSAFNRIPGQMAQAAARLESDLVYAQLLANGNMGDGGALFNATAITTAGGHANLYTGATSDLTPDADGVAAVGKLEEYLGVQRAPGTNSAMGLRGRYLLVPTALGTVARQMFEGGYVAASPSVVNPYGAQYQVILEPRLQLGVTIGKTTNAGSTTAFYLVADGIDTVHWGYLRGEAGPTIQSTVDFDTDGMKLKVSHNFGAKAVEWRGMAKSAGA